MIAKNLISKEIKAATITTSKEELIEEMERHQIYHLPYIEGAKLKGIISDEKLRNLDEKKINLDFLYDEVKAVYEKEYFFEVWSHMACNQLTCIPVIDEENNYLGSITQDRLVNYYTTSFAYTEPGTIIIISTKKQQYSLAKIAQIIEEENCVILSSFLSEKPEESQVLITIKINCLDIENILNSFYRHEIEVEAVFSDKEYSHIMKDRYHGLMNYLNV
ncbi:MAG: CBS domain-containing protein [Saprospiraceae bacterium]|nr:CBS domain-containing protein [Saprospiraceae bacterium]